MSNQPGVIGGPPKCLKTGLVVDMAISLGSGTPFLDYFDVPEPRNVAVLSGESGGAALQDTARRICRSRGIRLSACQVSWKFDLPRLSVEAECEQLADSLKRLKTALVFIDPLYLCLCTGEKPISTTNLYEVGPILKSVTDACKEAGAAPIFVHHMTKGASKVGKDVSPNLSDLAFAGISEFARQWVLVNRRSPYKPNVGRHELRIAAGGSGGHSGEWDVDVDEGVLREDLGGRHWETKVRDAVGSCGNESRNGKSKLTFSL